MLNSEPNRSVRFVHDLNDQDSTQKEKKLKKGVGNVLFNLFVFYYCVSHCCCCKKRYNNRMKKENYKKDPYLCRHILYSAITFTFSWCYFIGAIFIVPYLAQMFLNTLATATAVTIFIKRRELLLQHFRIITGIFTPVIIFMSAYAVWSLRDEVNDSNDSNDSTTTTDLTGYAFGVFISAINGIWIVISTIFICMIEDEMYYFDSYFVEYKIVSSNKNNNNNDNNQLNAENNYNDNPGGNVGEISSLKRKEIVSKTKAVSYFLGSMIKRRLRKKYKVNEKELLLQYNKELIEKYKSSLMNLSVNMHLVHLVFGITYVVCCILFTRMNDNLFTLELIVYIMSFILGAIYFSWSMLKIRSKKYKKLSDDKKALKKERVKTKNSLKVTQMLTQMVVLFLGISGTRLLYALLANGIDFANIFELPTKIVAATVLCWFLLFYRTLEVFEWNLF